MTWRGRIWPANTGGAGYGDDEVDLKEGVAHQKAGRLKEAERIYRALLEEDPQRADAWNNLGLLYLDRRDTEKAVAYIGRALKINPGGPAFHHNIAGAYGRLGDLEKAESHYREAIRLEPSYASAYFNLTGIAKFSEGDPALGGIEKLLEKSALSPEDRCYLGFAAGKILDDLGDYDRAFSHYREGNAAKEVRFDRKEHERRTDDLIRIFDREYFEAHSDFGIIDVVPIFVIGMPRSGTSLVEQTLASHPKIHGAGELYDVHAIARALPRHVKGGQGYPACMKAIDHAAAEGFALEYLKQTLRLAPKAKRIVDKHPLNFLNLGLIHLMFPKARVIHCRRDVLDTCLSCYFQNFTNGQEYSFDPEDLGFYYRHYRRLMTHWTKVLPEKPFDLNYEELVADHEPVARKLLAFVGLDWHDDCAAFHRTERTVQTASRWQVRQPIYRTSVRRWRNYERHIGPLIDALGDLAQESRGVD